MTESTICPACGGPLAYSADDEHVVCGFCDAGYDVVKEGDSPRLLLTTQPQPQKDQLSQATQVVAHQLEEEAVEDIDATYPRIIREAEGEPVAPSFATSATEWVMPDEVIPAAERPQQPYQVGSSTQPPRPANNNNRNLWLILGISFFVVFCILCLCLAGALILFINSNGGQFNF